MLMFEAIVVIVLDRGAERDLGIGDRRRRTPAAFALVFTLFAFLALFMPQMPQMLASSVIAILTGLTQSFHAFPAFALPFFLRPS